MTNQIYVNENIANITYSAAEAIMTATTGGVYYFGFKGFSDQDMYYLYLDTVSISVYVEILNPPNNLTAVVNNHDVHLAWTAPVVTRSLLGYKVYRNTSLIATLANPDTLSYDDPALTSGLYSYGVTAYYTSGESVPAGPVLADVDPVILPPSNLTSQVVDRDVNLYWTNPEGNWFTWCTNATGNSVGTGAAAVFDVAHRWEQADLAPFAGRSISRIQFIPVFANCVYTVKVWTGGSATSAGTLVHSQVVPSVVLNEWNTVFLTTQVPIPATGDLYYGYECNTQGGYPAGCDDGPPIEGKGNMMYFGGTWTTLTAIAPTLTYNWSIRAFAQIPPAGRITALSPVRDTEGYYLDTDALALDHYQPTNPERVITGYKVYRDGVLQATINDSEIFTFFDPGLPNATYLYGVTCVAPTGESVPSTIEVVVNFQLAPVFFSDGFENYPDFATTFSPWTLRDVDQTTTAGIPGISFPGSGGPLSFIVFNPSATTPPLTDLNPHGGSKMLASFSATVPPSNDWMVTPRVHLGTGSALKFFARSHADTLNMAKFRVGVCTLANIIPQGFQYVTGTDLISAPYGWHEYVYDLSNYDNQLVYVGIRNVSDQTSVLYVDDFSLHSVGGSVDNDDPTAPALQNALLGNYPNPFNPETTIRFSTATDGPVTLDIYNLRGQLVKRLVDEQKAAGLHSVVFDGTDSTGRPIASGVYYYKMLAGKYSSTRKMILMK